MSHTDQVLAKYLSYADKILVLNNGQIEHKGTYQQLLHNGLSDVIDMTNTNDAEKAETKQVETVKPPLPEVKEKSTPVDSTPAEADDTRATGDWNIYKYYFKSIGLRDGSLFVVLTAVSAFFMSFGSE